mmetsp:Transcript_45257/g.75534  ORF Transcript_45257/g.75534 Transcript_45257/m.75534 type:complete len:336 (+) Transcript_45257:2106-3113(+)
MHISVVDQHSVEVVNGRGVKLSVVRHVLCEFEFGGELKTVVDFDHGLLVKVKLESLELDREDLGEGLDERSLLGGLETVALGLVLVVSVEHLNLDVLVEGLVEVLASLYVQRDVVEGFVALGCVLDVDALDKVLVLTLEEALDGTLDLSSLHLGLEVVREHAVELLDVVLRVRVLLRPTKRLCELGGADGALGELHAEEETLERQRDRDLLTVTVRGHLVHSLSEVTEVVKGLEERVHVASGTLVLEANKAGLLLGILVERVGLVTSVGLEDDGGDTDDDGIIFGDVALVHVLPGDEVVESPVAVVAGKDVVGLTQEGLGLVIPVLDGDAELHFL